MISYLESAVQYPPPVVVYVFASRLVLLSSAEHHLILRHFLKEFWVLKGIAWNSFEIDSPVDGYPIHC